MLVYYDSFVAVGGLCGSEFGKGRPIVCPLPLSVQLAGLADVFRAAAHDAMSVHAALVRVHASRLHLLCCIA
mgnify:CR=1 FL=1